MRRLMAAAALAVLCTTAAACSDGDDSPSASAAGATASATASASATATGSADGTGTGNTKQICADAQKVVTDAFTKFGQEVAKISSSGNRAAAARTIKALFTEWADGMRDLAAKATDAQLKAALTETADQIAKVAASIKSADLGQADKLLDSADMQAAQAKYEALCG